LTRPLEDAEPKWTTTGAPELSWTLAEALTRFHPSPEALVIAFASISTRLNVNDKVFKKSWLDGVIESYIRWELDWDLSSNNVYNTMPPGEKEAFIWEQVRRFRQAFDARNENRSLNGMKDKLVPIWQEKLLELFEKSMDKMVKKIQENTELKAIYKWTRDKKDIEETKDHKRTNN
jgi:hypothetical protein